MKLNLKMTSLAAPIQFECDIVESDHVYFYRERHDHWRLDVVTPEGRMTLADGDDNKEDWSIERHLGRFLELVGRQEARPLAFEYEHEFPLDKPPIRATL